MRHLYVSLVGLIALFSMSISIALATTTYQCPKPGNIIFKATQKTDQWNANGLYYGHIFTGSTFNTSDNAKPNGFGFAFVGVAGSNHPFLNCNYTPTGNVTNAPSLLVDLPANAETACHFKSQKHVKNPWPCYSVSCQLVCK